MLNQSLYGISIRLQLKRQMANDGDDYITIGKTVC